MAWGERAQIKELEAKVKQLTDELAKTKLELEGAYEDINNLEDRLDDFREDR